MRGKGPRSWLRLGLVSLAVAATAAGAYLAWWKPLALAALRLALDSQLAGIHPGIKYDSVNLSGLNTLAISQVRIGTLDDPHSLLIGELRLTFSLKDLILGRFRAPAALSRVHLDRPQLTLNFPGPERTDRPFPPIPIPKVTLRLRDGRILLRTGPGNARLIKLSGIEGWMRMDDKTALFEASATLPESSSHGLIIRGRKAEREAACSVSLRDATLEALAPWASLARFPIRPESGRVSADIDLDFIRAPASETWKLVGIKGDIRPDGAAVAIPVFPGRLESVSGKIRCTGTGYSSSRLRLKARGTEWEVRGVVNGISGRSFTVHASADAVRISDWYRGAQGSGKCGLILRGTSVSPVLDIRAEFGPTVLHGIACSSLQGQAVLTKGFTALKLSTISASVLGAQVRGTGEWNLKEFAGTAEWSVSPCGRIPAISGTLRMDGRKLALSGSTGDGEWDFRAAAVSEKAAWRTELNGTAMRGGTIVLKSLIGKDHPQALKGNLTLSGISERSLYMPACMRPLGLSISATGRIDGILTRPRAAIELKNCMIALGERTADLDAGITLAAGPGIFELELADARIAGAGIIAGGAGKFRMEGGTAYAEADFIISHLRQREAEIEGRSAIVLRRDAREQRIECRLSTVRLDGLAYPDFSASLTKDREGLLTVNAAWEELLSASAKVEDDDEPKIRLSAAFGGLPLASLAGLIGAPAPAKSLSGSLTARGRLNHASIRASLDWIHGNGDLKGWINLAGLKDFSLTVDVAEQNASSWFPALASIANFRAMPSGEAEIETHSMSIERRGGALSVNGWLSFRSLRLSGRNLGSGNLRVSAGPERTELEGTLAGEAGSVSLYPSHISHSDTGRSLKTEFSFSNLAIGKAVLSCGHSGLSASWNGREGEGAAFISGLSLGDVRAEDMTASLDFRDGRWHIAPSPGSSLRVAGAVSLTQGLLKIEDGGTGTGRWLVFTGGEDAELGIAGELALPATLKRLRIRGRSLPARAILQVLGAPALRAKADADLSWIPQDSPSLRGRVVLSDGKWGNFPFARFEMTGEGTPGESFIFSSLVLQHERSLQASGTGKLTLTPKRSLELDLAVERILLGYLKPFGFVEESSVVANGKVRISGEPANPQMHGILRCAVGSFSPPLGFARLYLREGRIAFNGHTALIEANLADLAGAAVLFEGAADYEAMVPRTFNLLMTAPSLVLIDGLPDLFEGSAKGKLRFAGDMRNPVLRGQITIENGQLRNPPRRKQRDPESLAQRVNWDLRIKFGRNVKYALEPLGVPVVNLAKLSPSPLSHIEVAGSGDDLRIYGAVHADSGPLKLFLGREIWKKERRNELTDSAREP